MALSRRGRDRAIDYWPGFVDALSTLLLVFTFLLTVFMIAQFFLTQEISGKETVLNRLTAQIKQLSELLSLERANSGSLEDQMATLRASLKSAESERDKLRAGAESGDKTISAQLDNERDLNQRAASQIEILNRQIADLRKQLAAIQEALDASEQHNKESQAKISDLGQRLNVALRSACRSSRATAPSSSGGSAKFSATGPISALSATASCFSPRCCSTRAPRRSGRRHCRRSTRSRKRCASLRSTFPGTSPGSSVSTATPTRVRSRRRNFRRTGSCRRRARLRSCNT